MNERRYSSCSYCGSAVNEQHVRLEMWFGDTLVIFEHVPAGVCDNCGEEYFRADIQDKMIALARTPAAKRIEVPVYSFSDPLSVAKAQAAQKKREKERDAEDSATMPLASDDELANLTDTDLEDWGDG
jgi:YgiT-type zinc finger domain-containing protein